MRAAVTLHRDLGAEKDLTSNRVAVGFRASEFIGIFFRERGGIAVKNVASGDISILKVDGVFLAVSFLSYIRAYFGKETKVQDL